MTYEIHKLSEGILKILNKKKKWIIDIDLKSTYPHMQQQEIYNLLANQSLIHWASNKLEHTPMIVIYPFIL